MMAQEEITLEAVQKKLESLGIIVNIVRLMKNEKHEVDLFYLWSSCAEV